MRVLILSHYYKPEPIPKPAELAEELVRRGHTVTVLTGLPNYPSGTLYPGYNLRLVKRGEEDGIPVVRCFEFPYHGKSVVGRLLNYGSFMLSAPLGCLFLPQCDVIYVWHPPLTVGVAAWIVGMLRRVPFVYDVQDIWPDGAVLVGMLKEGWVTRMMGRLEHFVYKRAHHVFVVTAGARENLLAKGVPPEKVSVMPHWVDEGLFASASEEDRRRVRDQHGWKDRFIVMFAGNIGMVQGLDTVVDAAELLAEPQGVGIVIVGDGADKPRLIELVQSKGLEDRVQFVDRRPMEAMPALLTAADALLVHLKTPELARYAIPTKTLAYMAAGRPILMAGEGAAADLVSEANAGMVIPAQNPALLAEAIRSLAHTPAAERDAMGRRGLAYLKAHLTKKRVIPLYEAALQKAACITQAQV